MENKTTKLYQQRIPKTKRESCSCPVVNKSERIYVENHFVPLGDIARVKRFHPRPPPSKESIYSCMPERSRDVLCSWLFDVLLELPVVFYSEYKLDFEITWLPVFWSTVHLVHNYMRIERETNNRQWQLIGATCLFTALKLHGHLVNVQYVNYFTDGLYEDIQMLMKERDILETINYEMPTVTPCDYMTLILENNTCENCNGVVKDVTRYTEFIRIKTLLLKIVTANIAYNHQFMDKYTPFEIAAAVLKPESFDAKLDLEEVNRELHNRLNITAEELVRIRQCIKDLSRFRWNNLIEPAEQKEWRTVMEMGQALISELTTT